MPKRKNNWPKGLRNIPSGSSNYYWESPYRRGRKPTRKKTPLESSRLEAAKNEAVLLQAQFDEGEFDPWRDRYEPSASVERVKQAYLEAHAHQAKSTLKNKRSLLKRLASFLGPGRAIRSVESSDVEHFVLGQAWASSTQNANVVRIGAFFGFALEEGYIEEDPTEEAARRLARRERSWHAREKQRSKRKPIFPKALLRLTSVYRQEVQESPYRTSNVAADVFEALLASGLRRSEICHLCRQDLRIRKVNEQPGGPHGEDGIPVCGTARVRPWENPRTGERFVPKNENAVRTVPLTPRAALLFSQHLEANPTEDGWQPAILSAKGNRLDPDTLTQQFKEERERHGFGRDITLHSTRHGYITVLMMLRLSPYLVRDIAGHSDLSTQSRYVTFAEDYLGGRAAEARQEALSFFCPGLPEEVLTAAAGGGETWLSRRGYGGANAGGANAPDRERQAPIESVLYEGALYRRREGNKGRFAQYMRKSQ